MKDGGIVLPWNAALCATAHNSLSVGRVSLSEIVCWPSEFGSSFVDRFCYQEADKGIASKNREPQKSLLQGEPPFMKV